MNGKKRVWPLAAILGALLFVFTTGSALANPVFYAKIDNKTDHPVRIKWYFSYRNGGKSTDVHVTSIAPHTTERFHGPQGYGRMVYSYDTGGKVMKQYIDADTDPRALNAFCFIKYNSHGYLRIVRPNG